jgi:sulfotransferase
MEKLYFIAGLPRSGSTILTNVLVQNPQIHCTPTSVLAQLVGDIKNNWHNLPLTRNLPEATSYTKLAGVLQGLIEGYFKGVNQPYIFDKSRQWPQHLETLTTLGYEPKIIATVRDIRAIVASFEKVYSKSMALGMPSQYNADPATMSNPDTRLEYWLMSKSPLGSAFNILLDAFRRGHTENIHIVRFEDFTAYPVQTLLGIYDFLGLPPFEHDCKNVVQTIFEDDRSHGFKDLHKITEGPIKPVKDVWQQILPSSFADKIKGSNFWEK